MADEKMSELPAASSILNAEYFEKVSQIPPEGEGPPVLVNERTPFSLLKDFLFDADRIASLKGEILDGVKVYQALLSSPAQQTDPDNTITFWRLLAGHTYHISTGSETADFSNIGGPAAGSANIDVEFKATSSGVPAVWGGAVVYEVYVPSVRVLLDTMEANIVWTPGEGGSLLGTSEGAFPAGLTLAFAGTSTYDAGGGGDMARVFRMDADSILVSPSGEDVLNGVCVSIMLFPDVQQTISTPAVVPSTNLAVSIGDYMAEQIKGLTPGSGTTAIYSAINDSSHTYTRNVELWLGGVDISCIPAYNSGSGPNYQGVLITPDVMLVARHAPPSGTIYFVSMDNQVYSRTIIGTNDPVRRSPATNDLRLLRLSSPLPSDIVPAKILNFTVDRTFGTDAECSKLLTADFASGNKVFMAYSNHSREIHIAALKALIDSANGQGNYQTNLQSPWGDWFTTVDSPDSGSLMFLPINGELVALATMYGAAPAFKSFGGNCIGLERDAINAGIATLGGSGPMSAADLSGFDDVNS